MKRALDRRTASCGNGPSEERGPANLPTSAMRAPISSALFVPPEASGRRSRCPSPTPRRCSSISRKSPATSPRERTPSCCSTAPDGTPPPSSDVPSNITPIFLPSRAPELNPVENIWQFLRSNWLSNLVFETYDDIIDAACDAWRKLIAQPETITSIGMRQWAHIGQTP